MSAPSLIVRPVPRLIGSSTEHEGRFNRDYWCWQYRMYACVPIAMYSKETLIKAGNRFWKWKDIKWEESDSTCQVIDVTDNDKKETENENDFSTAGCQSHQKRVSKHTMMWAATYRDVDRFSSDRQRFMFQKSFKATQTDPICWFIMAAFSWHTRILREGSMYHSPPFFSFLFFVQ